MASFVPRAVLRQPLSARGLLASTRSLPRAAMTPTPTMPATRFVAAARISARRSYSSAAPPPNSSSSSSSPPPPPPPTPKPSPIKFWPFVVVIALGFGGYALLINDRNKARKDKSEAGGAADKPKFSEDEVSVVFVLGGPGAGKGTQCARLVKQYGFTHLSAGDLLRAEQDRPGSQFGQLIKDYIRDGAIVPMEVTIKLLENAMAADIEKRGSAKGAKFLVDGFPRKMDQAVAFERAVCRAKLVLFYECPEAELERRLMERGKTSGRADDNAESIRKRFRTFVETSMPVVDAFAKEGRVVKIDSTPAPDAVFAETQKQLTARLEL